jgi:uncharacterized protein
MTDRTDQADQTGLTLLHHPEHLAVVRLGPGSEIPAWATSATIFSVTATAEETSIVCARHGVPRKAKQEGPYVAFSVEGTLDLALTGVLSSILMPLAEAEVPVFTLATYDTDWVLVPVGQVERVTEAWRRAGFAVRPALDPEGTA